jgi:tetratricopeptide (TPR) repeat protein
MRLVLATSIEVAKTRENMANIYLQQGLYDQALEIYNSVLETKVRVVGHDHDPDVATSYFNMGLVYRSQEKTEEAEEMFTKAYSIFLKVLGPDHPHTQKAKSMRLK